MASDNDDDDDDGDADADADAAMATEMLGAKLMIDITWMMIQA